MVSRSEDDIAMDVDPGSRIKRGSEGLEQYKLDDYDDEAITSSMYGCINLLILFSPMHLGMGVFSNIKGLTFYKDNEEDPYITLKAVCLAEQI